MEPREVLRKDLIGFLKGELFGPANGEFEVLDDPPTQRYIVGVLFPTQQTVDPDDGSAPEEEDAAEEPLRASGLNDPDVGDENPEEEASLDRSTNEGDDEASCDDPILLANAYQPSAIGLTCMLAPGQSDLTVTLTAATYRSRKAPPTPRGYTPTEWAREPVLLEVQHFQLSDQPLDAHSRHLIAGRLTMRVVARRLKNAARLVTVAMFNVTPGRKDGPAYARDCFFQVGFTIDGPPGSFPFCELPSSHRPLDDLEADSLSLLYRNPLVSKIG